MARKIRQCGKRVARTSTFAEHQGRFAHGSHCTLQTTSMRGASCRHITVRGRQRDVASDAPQPRDTRGRWRTPGATPSMPEAEQHVSRPVRAPDRSRAAWKTQCRQQGFAADNFVAAAESSAAIVSSRSASAHDFGSAESMPMLGHQLAWTERAGQALRGGTCKSAGYQFGDELCQYRA